MNAVNHAGSRDLAVNLRHAGKKGASRKTVLTRFGEALDETRHHEACRVIDDYAHLLPHGTTPAECRPAKRHIL
jgi:hypothetical protein